MSRLRFAEIIALVLRVGVIGSSALIVVGLGAAMVVGWGGASASGGTVDATDFSDLLPRLRDGQPLAVVQLGLVVLMLTPVVRVAVSVVGFALERDRLYVAITLGVLAILVIGLTLFR
jgi:uncharacterized membrane protein